MKVGAYYLSELLLLDTVTCAVIAIPTSLFWRSGILLWVLTGILIGHIIDLLIFSFFGLRISYRKTKGQFLRDIANLATFRAT